MNISEMMNLLGLRLEDADKVTFTDVLKLRALNNGQLKVANLVHPGYLTELQYLQDSPTIATGVITISSAFTYGVLRGQQGIIRIKDISTGLWLTPIDMMDVKRLENTYLAASAQNPMFYVFQNRIYLQPTTISDVDVYYLRVPAELLYPFTSNQADSGASTTKFDGLTGESLSTTNDAYNGAVIYNIEKAAYFVVTDYVGADLEFTVSPAAGANFTEGQTFYFLTHTFDTLNLSGLDCPLNEALHELVVSFAEAECWRMDNKQPRADAVLQSAIAEVKLLNEVYKEPEGIGTDGRKQ